MAIILFKVFVRKKDRITLQEAEKERLLEEERRKEEEKRKKERKEESIKVGHSMITL